MITQTPWIERKFAFGFPVGLFPVILERLRGTLPRLEAMVINIPDEKLSLKKDGKWSIKEVLGHLYDIEALWDGRINDFLEHKETLQAADMSNTKTHAANHNLKPITELLQQFSEVRNKLIERVKDLNEASASIMAVHPRLQTTIRLVDSLFFVAEHDDHELTKIRNMI
jgi:uncharacterized damage-inducible protein DinB